MRENTQLSRTFQAVPTAPKEYLTSSEVALLLSVSANTVTRWARAGKLSCQLTLGGHRRFDRSSVEELQRRLMRDGSVS